MARCEEKQITKWLDWNGTVLKFRSFLSLISRSVVLITPTLLPSCHLAFVLYLDNFLL